MIKGKKKKKTTLQNAKSGLNKTVCTLFNIIHANLSCRVYMLHFNKAVLEPRVSPAFASTYFCNHCNIRFENTSTYVDTLIFFPKTWTKGHWPYMTFDPMSVEVTCVTLPKDHCVQVPWQYINVCGYSDQFCKLPYHIHTHTTYIHTTYILRTEWVIT